jgi:hypothetical protein
MSRHEFREVEVLREGELICVVTARTTADGKDYHAFAILKEYERDGQIYRSGFMNRRHVASARKLLERVEGWLDETSGRVRK